MKTTKLLDNSDCKMGSTSAISLMGTLEWKKTSFRETGRWLPVGSDERADGLKLLFVDLWKFDRKRYVGKSNAYKYAFENTNQPPISSLGKLFHFVAWLLHKICLLFE